ncbi:MAG: hypothetical protein A6F71_10185 [Cycloclasticus sp. symbiont of Poecilosclerida sp. M]|nr:MAG: hypothetical protein A6F71_10185 [Cycloclasticus sp. symbiont of Poecilosclerida sp. M]
MRWVCSRSCDILHEVGDWAEVGGGMKLRSCDLMQEKVDAMEVLGADVRLVPAVPFTDPKNYNHQSI